MQLKINGKKVFFTTFGSGKQLLILPGWMHHHEIWERMQTDLSRFFQTTVLDFPGFGQSQIDLDIKDLNGYARFLKKAVEELGLKNFTILGHSFGGSVAIKTISLFPPKELTNLILVDTSGIRRLNPKKLLGILLSKPGKILFSLPVIKKWEKPVKKLLYRKLGETDYLNAGPLKDVFKRIVNENLEGILDRINVPTDIIWGAKDDVTPLAEARILHQKIKNSQLHILKNSSHCPFLDQPKDFLSVIKEIRS